MSQTTALVHIGPLASLPQAVTLRLSPSQMSLCKAGPWAGSSGQQERFAAGGATSMAAVPDQSQHNNPMAQAPCPEQGSHLLGCCWETSALVLWGLWEQGLPQCLESQRLAYLQSAALSTSKGASPKRGAQESRDSTGDTLTRQGKQPGVESRLVGGAPISGSRSMGTLDTAGTGSTVLQCWQLLRQPPTLLCSGLSSWAQHGVPWPPACSACALRGSCCGPWPCRSGCSSGRAPAMSPAASGLREQSRSWATCTPRCCR